MNLTRPIRYRCDLEARLDRPDQGPQPVRVVDLSESGAFLETSLDIQFGEQAQLALELPRSGRWAVGVTVMRLGSCQREIIHPRVEHVTVARSGVGVLFDPLTPQQRKQLRTFLALLDER